MLFADNKLLVNKIARGLNAKLKIWRKAQDSKGFNVSRNKTKYIEYKFSVSRSFYIERVNIQNQNILKSEKFWNLGSIFNKDGDIINDLTHMIQVC